MLCEQCRMREASIVTGSSKRDCDGAQLVQ